MVAGQTGRWGLSVRIAGKTSLRKGGKQMEEPTFIVVTEHWPRNPSKPVWWHVETRPIRAIDAELWIEISQKSRKKSKWSGKTFAVKIMSKEELREFYAR